MLDFFFLLLRRAPRSTLFPYTTLFRSNVASVLHLGRTGQNYFYAMEFVEGETLEKLIRRSGLLKVKLALEIDRKSTRLNSSHTVISYAVFCLKKKKKQSYKPRPQRSTL